jgi:hypothetical protein
LRVSSPQCPQRSPSGLSVRSRFAAPGDRISYLMMTGSFRPQFFTTSTHNSMRVHVLVLGHQKVRVGGGMRPGLRHSSVAVPPDYRYRPTGYERGRTPVRAISLIRLISSISARWHSPSSMQPRKAWVSRSPKSLSVMSCALRVAVATFSAGHYCLCGRGSSTSVS